MENIKINHIGLLNFNEDHAKKFYGELLGLNEQYSFELKEEETQKIFGIRQKLKVLGFGRDHVKLEIFIASQKIDFAPLANHLCLELPNREAFLSRCKQEGVFIVELPRKNKVAVFVRDFAGNVLEIKEIIQ